jgi:glyoxylase-like metal-dependent hydrolase (beta-lactamase superfamily II)
MSDGEFFFEQIRSSGCLSYILGCATDKVSVVIDPELDKAADYVGVADFFKSKLLYAIDTHTHADHNSACKLMRERYGVQVVMHRAADAPYVDVKVDDGDEIKFGQCSLRVFYTPGHTQDAMCLLFDDRIFTGDTLLIGGCGRTDLPGGSAENQWDSLRRLEGLSNEIRLYPGHDYREAVSTLGEEKTEKSAHDDNVERRVHSVHDRAQTAPAAQDPRGARMEPHADLSPERLGGRDLAGC